MEDDAKNTRVEKTRQEYKIMWQKEKEAEERRKKEMKVMSDGLSDYLRRNKNGSWYPMAIEMGLTPVDIGVIRTETMDRQEQLRRVLELWRYNMIMSGYGPQMGANIIIEYLGNAQMFDTLRFLQPMVLKKLGIEMDVDQIRKDVKAKIAFEARLKEEEERANAEAVAIGNGTVNGINGDADCVSKG
ncbi:Hypp7433 [Branchiostoma lanceolatum]|uniref:Hypp7433 protein n=1 Tax=Branchiostoma lanceolatum TaxID=7740 RepID=A0A8J9Z0S4_BRALA|nr:Hypp7433 [Branchiostoma lanceolatum]